MGMKPACALATTLSSACRNRSARPGSRSSSRSATSAWSSSGSAAAYAGTRSATSRCSTGTASSRCAAPAAGSCSRRGRTGFRTAATSSRARAISWRSTSPSDGTRSTGSCAGRRGRSSSTRPIGRSLEHRLHPTPGYPFTLDLRVEYSLAEDGLTVRVEATNVGEEPCPYGFGAHPYLAGGDGRVDGLELRIPAETALISDERSIPIGRAVGRRDGARLPHLEADRLGAARPLLHRSLARPRRPRPGRARRPGDALGRRELPVRDGLHRRCASGRRAAQRRRRADDVCAERVPKRRRPDPSRARASRTRAAGESPPPWADARAIWQGFGDDGARQRSRDPVGATPRVAARARRPRAVRPARRCARRRLLRRGADRLRAEVHRARSRRSSGCRSASGSHSCIWAA